MEETRKFSRINSIKDLEDIKDLLGIPRFGVNENIIENLKPKMLKNIPYERALIKYFHRDTHGFVNEEIPLREERIWSIGISTCDLPDDNFDYLIFAPEKDYKPNEETPDEKVKCTRLQNILYYKKL
jgi:hypothetical protein